MSQFRPIDDGYISRNFNDRRIGGKTYRNGQYPPSDKGYGHWPDKPKGTGGTKLPRKPKNPKTPMPAKAVAIKHELKGY